MELNQLNLHNTNSPSNNPTQPNNPQQPPNLLRKERRKLNLLHKNPGPPLTPDLSLWP
jgi:hypothetical protein